MEKEKPMEKSSNNQIVSNNFSNYFNRKQRSERGPDMHGPTPTHQRGGRNRGSPAQSNQREKSGKQNSPQLRQTSESILMVPSDDEVIAEYVEDYGPYPPHQHRNRKQDRGGVSSKRHEKPANHLLNFSFAERPKPAPVPFAAKKRSGGPRAQIFRKETFVAANYRLVVSRAAIHSCSGSLDQTVDWDTVEQVCLSTHEQYVCPICLEPPLAAKITMCGHIFCGPCIYRYLGEGGDFRRCPICFESVYKMRLKNVQILVDRRYFPGDSIDFVLLQRQKSSIIVYPRAEYFKREEARRSGVSLFPLYTDPAAPFSRINIVTDPTELLRKEEQELDSAIAKGQETADESLPYLLRAQEELQKTRAKIAAAAHSPAEPALPTASTSPSSKIVTAETRRLVQSAPEPLSFISSPAASRVWDEEGGSDLEFDGEGDDDHVPKEEAAEHDAAKKPEKQKHEETPAVSAPAAGREHQQQHSNPTSMMTEDYVFFYQAHDGQLLFLHPFNVRQLMHEFGGLVDHCPDRLPAMKIVDSEELHQTEILRRRIKHLSHVPLTGTFSLVEVDLRPILSRDTVRYFAGEMKAREAARKSKGVAEAQSRERERLAELQRRADKINLAEFPPTSPLPSSPPTPSPLVVTNGPPPAVAGSPAPLLLLPEVPFENDQEGVSPPAPAASFKAALKASKPAPVPQLKKKANKQRDAKQLLAFSNNSSRRY